MVQRMTRTLAALALLLGSCAPPPPAAQQRGPDAELAGRVAGAPERCVSISSQQSLRVSDSDRHMLLYGNGRTIWANRLGQCTFGSNDVLVTEPMGSYYCRGDLVRSFDRQSRIPGPACVLGEFVPYNRP
ncbi:MAG: hypothetical protein QOF05_490 [Sphingomonadales bacterium]|jgi:hypothetical protein|nr:hypothetical protein [Sphingomonadales bacterium]